MEYPEEQQHRTGTSEFIIDLIVSLLIFFMLETLLTFVQKSFRFALVNLHPEVFVL